MPVNYQAPDFLPEIPGIRIGIASAGIKKPGRKDITLFELAPEASVAGVFTRNRFCAAPVALCRERLAGGKGVRALVVNTGNANAGTGDQGMADAKTVCAQVADLLQIDPEAVLPFSTGVIMEPLPVAKIAAALPAAVADLRTDNWLAAATSIMTTDTVAKGAWREVETPAGRVRIGGISKGAGMIRPNMATMLAYVGIDAQMEAAELQSLLDSIADQSFNAITIDGDTSTNDSFILIAGGQGPKVKAADIAEAVAEVAVALAQAIIRDGEGATKFVTVRVGGGKTREECRKVAYSIAHSPLVKTAFFASDPNLGRILAAIGYAGIDDLDVNGVSLRLDDVLVAEGGGRAVSYREEDGKAAMAKAEFTVDVDLGRGEAEATIWTSDLSHDYVSINADYRS